MHNDRRDKTGQVGLGWVMGQIEFGPKRVTFITAKNASVGLGLPGRI